MRKPKYDNLYGRDRPVQVRGCDCPGCFEPGDYRAPRDRSLQTYYYFCLTHVRDYNQNWDFFSGMTGGDIEGYIRDASTWERPTWPLGQWKIREQQLRDQAMKDFFEEEAPQPTRAMPKTERDALTLLELVPPVDFTAIKAQYRVLVKRHHPDANGGSREAEERFKSINQAFATLKQIYSEEAVSAN